MEPLIHKWNFNQGGDEAIKGWVQIEKRTKDDFYGALTFRRLEKDLELTKEPKREAKLKKEKYLKEKDVKLCQILAVGQVRRGLRTDSWT